MLFRIKNQKKLISIYDKKINNVHVHVDVPLKLQVYNVRASGHKSDLHCKGSRAVTAHQLILSLEVRTTHTL